MDWQEEGIILAHRHHGENAAIVEALTKGHGRHLGIVRGGAGRRMAPHLQPGTQVHLRWSSRLSEHLGTFQVEPIRSRAGLMSERGLLAGLNAIVALCHVALPERSEVAALYTETLGLLDGMCAGAPWIGGYAQWELLLLQELGAAPDLTKCGVTGGTHDLDFVSPKTGRAISRVAAGEWADRLLPLPAFLTSDAPADVTGVLAALRMTGFFLLKGLEPMFQGQGLPASRARLLTWLEKDWLEKEKPGSAPGF